MIKAEETEQVPAELMPERRLTTIDDFDLDQLLDEEEARIKDELEAKAIPETDTGEEETPQVIAFDPQLIIPRKQKPEALLPEISGPVKRLIPGLGLWKSTE